MGFVRSYYALLPGNTDAAWALLGPTARAESGGRATFNSFYAGLQAVSVDSARQVGDNTVQATIRFVRQDGTTTNEAYRFVMGTDGNGNTIMQSFGKGG